MQQLDEQTVIAPLLGYAPFARFYRQQRPKLRAPIEWMLDPTLISDGVNSPMSDGSVRICLKHIPVTLDDAHTVAHELAHSLLDQEGYPSLMLRALLAGPVDVPDGLRLLIAILNGILDLEVDRRLRTVGFTGERLMTLDALERSWAHHANPATAARFRQIAETTGYRSPDQVRQFFLRVQPSIKADTVIIGESAHGHHRRN